VRTENDISRGGTDPSPSRFRRIKHAYLPIDAKPYSLQFPDHCPGTPSAHGESWLIERIISGMTSVNQSFDEGRILRIPGLLETMDWEQPLQSLSCWAGSYLSSYASSSWEVTVQMAGLTECFVRQSTHRVLGSFWPTHRELTRNALSQHCVGNLRIDRSLSRPSSRSTGRPPRQSRVSSLQAAACNSA
jgi:hypothetical protein